MEKSSFFKLTTTLYCPYLAQKNKFLHIQLIAYKDREPSFKMEFLPSTSLSSEMDIKNVLYNTVKLPVILEEIRLKQNLMNSLHRKRMR